LIAEYSADYPDFLANRAGAERLPYLRAFAEVSGMSGRCRSRSIDHR
jgi:hypothetical protein